MKTEELKLRVIRSAESLIDTYYGGSNIVEKLMNSTMKALLHQNTDKVESFMRMFKDKTTGEVNADELIATYARQFENGVEFDIRDYIDDEFISGLLPCKKLVINKEDIIGILK